jgi:hypothetical protein
MIDEIEVIRARHWVAGQYVTLALDAGQQAHADRGTLLSALDALPELLDRIERLERLEAALQNIANPMNDGDEFALRAEARAALEN